MHKRNTSAQGFTIAELLIVVVVIAILAAISIVAFTGIQERAIASAVKSDLNGFAKQIELEKIEGDGLYPAVLSVTTSVTATKSMYKTTHIGSGTPRSNWYYCPSPDRSGYALGVVDIKDRGYNQSSNGGLQEKANSNTNIQDAGSVCSEVGSPGSSVTTGMNSGEWRSWVNG
ncbi:MAG: type II secretion system GspH family protein [Thermomicrobiales bacterium]|nr:type II secretion system GspH family protein [Thermomicrobiales bacterium]